MPDTPAPKPASGPKTRPAAAPRRRTAPRVKRLIETAGPAPTTPVSEVFLTEGVLAGSHGVRGELKMRILTDRPEHFATLKRVFIGEPPVPMRLLGVREHGDLLLIRLEGVTTPEQAKELSGKAVKIAGSDARPLEEGEYFLFQLIGLRVEDEQGAEIGTVSDLIETGANDVLVIAPSAGGPDILVPNHPQYVLKLAPEDGLLVARLPQYDS
ncbi:MAG TPA: ribosome maturation factor RimM [Thermomicrobiales bacterium]|nr:ribosome maturation factor RimM [Thermomicrobiales bacterium]